MATYTYPGDFSADDWSDLPSLSADDIVDGAGHVFTDRLIIPTAGVTWRNFEIALGGAGTGAIAVSSMDNTTIRDVVIGGGTVDGLTQGNPALSVDGLTLINVTAKDFGQDAFQLGHPTGGGCTNLVLRNITSLRNGHTGLVLVNSPNADVDGVTIIDCGSTGNLDGLAITSGCEGSVIANVVVKGQKSGSSIDIQDQTGSAQIILRNARVEHPAGLTVDGIAVTGSAPVLVYNCVVDGHRYNYLSKSLAAHEFTNILSTNAREHGVRAGVSGAAGALTLRNAIVHGATNTNVRVQEDEGAPSTYVGENNLFETGVNFYWKGSIKTSLSSWVTASGTDGASIETDDPGLDYRGIPSIHSLAYRAGVYVAGFHDTYLDHKGHPFGNPPTIGRQRAA